jgi:hypothetical protein
MWCYSLNILYSINWPGLAGYCHMLQVCTIQPRKRGHYVLYCEGGANVSRTTNPIPLQQVSMCHMPTIWLLHCVILQHHTEQQESSRIIRYSCMMGWCVAGHVTEASKLSNMLYWCNQPREATCQQGSAKGVWCFQGELHSYKFCWNSPNAIHCMTVQYTTQVPYKNLVCMPVYLSGCLGTKLGLMFWWMSNALHPPYRP